MKKSANKNKPKKSKEKTEIKKEIIPPGLEFFDQFKDKSSVQIISQIFPKFADALKTDQAQNTIDAFAGLFWGQGLDLGALLPEWAKLASEKFSQTSGMDFCSRLEKEQPADFGRIFELINSELINKDLSPDQEQMVKYLGQTIKSDLGNLSAEELKQFADARVAAPKIIEKLKTPSERTIVFLIIALAWRHIEPLGSHVRTHQWLLENKIISPNTDRAETAKWFREIALPKGKSGRPKKNADCVKNE